MCAYPFQGHVAFLWVISPRFPSQVLSGSCWQQAGRAASSTLFLAAQAYTDAEKCIQAIASPDDCPYWVLGSSPEGL